jgi:hypothetical protein
MTVPKRFGVLRFFGTLLKVIAWIVLVLGILSAVGAIFAGGFLTSALPPEADTYAGLVSAGGGIVAALLIVLLSLFYFLILYVAGEQLHLWIAVEENSRLTAALLLRMHQEGQGDTAATTYGAGAGGGFVNEPYDN